MKKIVYLLLAFALYLLPGMENVQAQDFTYEPKNPAFGGDTFNYQWLQSSATAQDRLKDPTATASGSSARDPLKDFEQNLNRQILSQLSRQLVNSQFGEGALEPGNYVIGNYEIEVTEGPEGVNIVIIDAGTGNQTTVTIPFF